VGTLGATDVVRFGISEPASALDAVIADPTSIAAVSSARAIRLDLGIFLFLIAVRTRCRARPPSSAESKVLGVDAGRRRFFPLADRRREVR
jgi:hypothetical protein